MTNIWASLGSWPRPRPRPLHSSLPQPPHFGEENLKRPAEAGPPVRISFPSYWLCLLHQLPPQHNQLVAPSAPLGMPQAALCPSSRCVTQGPISRCLWA